MKDYDRSILFCSGVGRTALAEIDRLRGEVRALQRAALPSDCERCKGDGSDPPHGPEDGPCQRCGGWTEHKRLVAGETKLLTMERDNAIRERDAARAEVERLRAVLRDVRPSVEALVSMECREEDDFDALRAIDDALSETP